MVSYTGSKGRGLFARCPQSESHFDWSDISNKWLHNSFEDLFNIACVTGKLVLSSPHERGQGPLHTAGEACVVPLVVTSVHGPGTSKDLLHGEPVPFIQGGLQTY